MHCVYFIRQLLQLSYQPLVFVYVNIHSEVNELTLFSLLLHVTDVVSYSLLPHVLFQLRALVNHERMHQLVLKHNVYLLLIILLTYILFTENLIIKPEILQSIPHNAHLLFVNRVLE
jgi:hypothetical protein